MSSPALDNMYLTVRAERGTVLPMLSRHPGSLKSSYHKTQVKRFKSHNVIDESSVTIAFSKAKIVTLQPLDLGPIPSFPPYRAIQRCRLLHTIGAVRPTITYWIFPWLDIKPNGLQSHLVKVLLRGLRTSFYFIVRGVLRTPSRSNRNNLTAWWLDQRYRYRIKSESATGARGISSTESNPTVGDSRHAPCSTVKYSNRKSN